MCGFTIASRNLATKYFALETKFWHLRRHTLVNVTLLFYDISMKILFPGNRLTRIAYFFAVCDGNPRTKIALFLRSFKENRIFQRFFHECRAIFCDYLIILDFFQLSFDKIYDSPIFRVIFIFFLDIKLW